MAKIKNHMIVVFGATGSLAKDKLMPALYKLYEKGLITQTTPIVCVGRRKLTKNSYIDFMEFEKKLPTANGMILSGFQQLINYVRVDFEKNDFSNLFTSIDKLDKKNKCNGNKIFYLATPPSLFETITEQLKNSRAIAGKGYKRVAYEKPFGYDLKSAKELNNKIKECFTEEQIYRVDHYLGKELVQNILAARFSNPPIKHMWNKKFIDHIQITIAEASGIGKRAGYYDNSGAIRDMLQNHILQLVSLCAMDEPKDTNADTIRSQKVKVLKSLQPVQTKDMVLGQYSAGKIDDKKVNGYRQEENISANSDTESFVGAKLTSKIASLANVPIYVRTGKRMPETFGRIDVILKDVPNRLFENKSKTCKNNIFTIKIRPDEGIQLTINSKEPGDSMKIMPVELTFCHACKYGPNTPEAYEMLLTQVMKGDQTLFPRWDEVEASWKFIDKFMENAKKKKTKFPNYTAGSQPKEAESLLKRDGRSWVK